MTSDSAVPEAASESPGPEIAGVGSRALGGFIDVGVMMVLFLIMASQFGDFGSTDGPIGSSFSINLNGLPALVYFLLFFAYFIGMEVSMQATVGKLLAGTRVTNRDGGPASLGSIVVRTLLRIVDVLPFLYLIGFILVAVTPKNQRIGDLAAGTLVIRR